MNQFKKTAVKALCKALNITYSEKYTPEQIIKFAKDYCIIYRKPFRGVAVVLDEVDKKYTKVESPFKTKPKEEVVEEPKEIIEEPKEEEKEELEEEERDDIEVIDDPAYEEPKNDIEVLDDPAYEEPKNDIEVVEEPKETKSSKKKKK